MSSAAIAPHRIPCRYFAQGICRFGEACRFSHDLSTAASSQSRTTKSGGGGAHSSNQSSGGSWANAPVFIPSCYLSDQMSDMDLGATSSSGAENSKTWAQVAGGSDVAGGENADPEGSLCAYIKERCPYRENCIYQHIELCDMCSQYCLHPTDKDARRKHINECIQQHEQDMELSFAIARSKDKTCGICFDTIMEKTGKAKRFGILPNCSHIFCLDCIRKWRQAKQFEHKITRSCPECRVASDFVCPSAFWVETKEDKDKLLNSYKSALSGQDCKYFKKGDGKCPFGNKCFYKHALQNGSLVDVGLPKSARRIHRNTDEVIDLLDLYLRSFVDERDFNWLELLSSVADSDDYYDSDDDDDD